MKRPLVISAATAALALAAVVPSTFAATPDQSCWGVVSAQLARYSGGLGGHISEQSEPRLGLGNVARLFLGPDGKVYELGTLLASIDGIEATACP
jgi:hypothetical protein